MKTPRELLRTRHESATPQLDAGRAQTLAAAFPRARAPRRAAVWRHAWWQELFWPVRHAWLGLAAVWLVILGSHLATRERTHADPFVAAASPVLRQLLREQLRLRAELLDDAPPARPARPHLRDPRRSGISRSLPTA